MMAKDKPTLADYVEANERRAAPRVQARVANRGRAGPTPWIILAVLTAVVLGGAVAFLRFKRLI